MEPQVRDDGFFGVIRQATQKSARILVKRPLFYGKWQGHKLRLIGRVGMQLCAVRTEGYPVAVGDIMELRMYRFSASSRLRRYYFEGEELKSVRSIVKETGIYGKTQDELN